MIYFLKSNANQEEIIRYATQKREDTMATYHPNREEIERLNYFQKAIKEAIIKAQTSRQVKRNYRGVIFTFHVLLDPRERKIEMNNIDIKDQHSSKYGEMIGLHFSKSLQTNPDYLWILITDKEFMPEIDNIEDHSKKGNLILGSCDINHKELMFERACAACATSFLLNKNYNIAFLDGDAFPMRSFTPIWNSSADILLTKRRQHLDKSIIPVNEGVYFCKKGYSSITFFRRFFVTYSLLARDQGLKSFYRASIKRWRGGQLSLNVLSNVNDSLPDLDKLNIKYLSCHLFNCFPRVYAPMNINRKYVIHVKGHGKDFEMIKDTVHTK